MGKWEGSVRTSGPVQIARCPLTMGVVRLGWLYFDAGILGHTTCASCPRGLPLGVRSAIAPCGGQGSHHRRCTRINRPKNQATQRFSSKMWGVSISPPFDHADTRPGLRFELLMCLHPADYSHGPALTTQPLLVHVKIFSWRCSTKNGPFFGHFLPFI